LDGESFDSKDRVLKSVIEGLSVYVIAEALDLSVSVIVSIGSRCLRCLATSQACPRQDSNLRTRLRRPALYPLSYEGADPELYRVGRRPWLGP
jgi:hypothetical protein